MMIWFTGIIGNSSGIIVTLRGFRGAMTTILNWLILIIKIRCCTFTAGWVLRGSLLDSLHYRTIYGVVTASIRASVKLLLLELLRLIHWYLLLLLLLLWCIHVMWFEYWLLDSILNTETIWCSCLAEILLSNIAIGLLTWLG